MEIVGKRFFQSDDNRWEEAGDGIMRQVTVYDSNLMMVKVRFQTGAQGALHNHTHVQASFIATGVFDITVNGETKRLKAGDAFYAASDLNHAAKCVEKGVIIDVFNPYRADFL